MTYKTYALWGRGDISPVNAEALLTEYLPPLDEIGSIYRPDSVPRDHKGLRTALDFLDEYTAQVGGEVTPSTDILKSLANDAEENGDEIIVLALWPETPTHEDFDFIESVQMDGITVLDLSRAMDELDLSLYSRPEPTKEEKAEAKAAARKTTRSRKISDEPEVAGYVDGTTIVTETERQEIFAAPAPRIGAEYVASVISEEARLWAEVESARAALRKALDTYIQTTQVSMQPIREFMEAKEDAAVEDKPPFDPPYVGEHTKAYYWNKNTDTYRVAEGKPRRGETVVNLKPEEATEKGL